MNGKLPLISHGMNQLVLILTPIFSMRQVKEYGNILLAVMVLIVMENHMLEET